MEWPEALQILGYQNIVFIGEGLNSRVYRGNQKSQGHESTVIHVLKVSKNRNDVQEFERTYQSISKVRSKHSPAIFGLQLVSGSPVLIMDYVQGVSLSTIANTGRLELCLINEVISQIQQGLLDMHECGVIHGDLHPDNIMIDMTGRVQLIDYGLNLSREFEGSPAFMAPELWDGCAVSVGSDFFALALLEEDLVGWNHLGLRTVLELKKRSFDFIDEGDQWRRKDPSTRRANLSISSLSRNRHQLALIVQDVSETSEAGLYGTKVLKPSRLTDLEKLKNIVSAVLLIGTLACVPVSRAAKVDVLLNRPSELRVRTSKWVQVEINGASPRFSPFVQRTLPKGLVSIKWRSENTGGHFFLEIGSGEVVVLGDSDFVQDR